MNLIDAILDCRRIAMLTDKDYQLSVATLFVTGMPDAILEEAIKATNVDNEKGFESPLDLIHRLALVPTLPLLITRAKELDTHQAVLESHDFEALVDQLSKLDGPDPVWVVFAQAEDGNAVLLGFADEEDAKFTANSLGPGTICTQMAVAQKGTRLSFKKPTLVAPTASEVRKLTASDLSRLSRISR